MLYCYSILQVCNFVFSPSFFFWTNHRAEYSKKTKTIPNTYVTQLKTVTVVQESVWYGVLWRSHELQRFPGKSRAL